VVRASESGVIKAHQRLIMAHAYWAGVKTGLTPLSLLAANLETEVADPRNDAEWRSKLSPEQYRVLRQAGTEAPGTGALLHNKQQGRYRCAGCGATLFESDTKYDSGSGWPSFTAPAGEGSVAEHSDVSHGMVRTEVRCAKCEGHLGHVFPDGPGPDGLRYCINSASLAFDPDHAERAADDGKRKAD